MGAFVVQNGQVRENVGVGMIQFHTPGLTDAEGLAVAAAQQDITVGKLGAETGVVRV